MGAIGAVIAEELARREVAGYVPPPTVPTASQQAAASAMRKAVGRYTGATPVPQWGAVEQTFTAPAIAAEAAKVREQVAIWEHPLLKSFRPEWTLEEKEAYPLTPEGLLHPEAPIYSLVTAPGAKITELVKTTPVAEIEAMVGRGEFLTPGIAFPGIGEIKMPEIKFPDILGGLEDVGKYAIIAGAVLLGAFLLTRKK